MKDEVIRITGKRIFIRYSQCPMLRNCEDVEVDIPLLPLPGNLFDGFYFMNEEHRTIATVQQIKFFVEDVQHTFTKAEQYVLIVLQALPSAKQVTPPSHN